MQSLYNKIIKKSVKQLANLVKNKLDDSKSHDQIIEDLQKIQLAIQSIHKLIESYSDSMYSKDSD